MEEWSIKKRTPGVGKIRSNEKKIYSFVRGKAVEGEK